MDAKDTVVNILKELESGEQTDTQPDSRQELAKLLKERQVPVVTWSGFQKIVEVETSTERRRSEEQPREKLTDIKALLDAAQV